jgi:NADH:ubiquinone oxidoreductase subunit K
MHLLCHHLFSTLWRLVSAGCHGKIMSLLALSVGAVHLAVGLGVAL